LKKWIITGVVIAVLIGLACTTHLWLSPLLRFVGTNSDLIQGLTDLVQLVLWIAAGTVGLVSLWRKPNAPQETSDVDMSRRQAKMKSSSGAVSQGDGSPIAGESGLAVGRDFRGALYMGLPPDAQLVQRSSVLVSNIAWAERDREGVDFFIQNYRDGSYDELHESDLIGLLSNWELVDATSGLFLTQDGCLLFGPADRLPPGTSTDVLLTHEDGRIDTFFGLSLMTLFKRLYALLAELWEDVREDPSLRDALGRPQKVSSYPQTAIVEALVNFIVHRDYSNDQVAYITILGDRIELKNPGSSPYDKQQLLSYVEPLQPKYTRNTKLIWVFSRTRFNQRQGGGLYRIRQSLVENGNVTNGGNPALDIINDREEDRFTIIMYKRHLGPDLHKDVQRYLEYVADRNSYVSFKGMYASGVLSNLPLAELLVPLKVRVELPQGETWERWLEMPGGRFGVELERVETRVSESVDSLDFIQHHDGIVVLGDPGSGKTTLLRYLALQLALGRGEELGLSTGLPFLLPMSAYANALAERDIPLDRFIVEYYWNLGVDLPMDSLVDIALNQGHAVLLLDGLDEIQEHALRNLVINRVMDFFSFHRIKGNKFIFTSRIVGYRAIRPSAPGLVECTIVDFDDEDIDYFLQNLIVALNRATHGDTPLAVQKAARQKAELRSSIRGNLGMRQLAANPLLLTILTMTYWQGWRLPQRRIELYENSVRTLLEPWNLARSLDRPFALDIDLVETIRVLANLALWVLENRPTGLIKEKELQRQLISIYTDLHAEDPKREAQQLLINAREHAGLLVERGPGVYGFMHLVYEEFLAAVAMAQRPLETVVDLIASHITDARWHEPILLTVSHMGSVQGRVHDVDSILLELIQRSPGEPGQAIILATRAVLDNWPGGVSPGCRREVEEALQRLVQEDAQLDPVRRSEAENLLMQLEDV